MAGPVTGHGPLAGIRVIELPGIGPLPFACMLLADLGADVIRIDRPDDVGRQPETTLDTALLLLDPLGRNRRRLAIDLRRPEGAELLLRLAETADVVVESFRPGVAERLGVGPHDCRSRNQRLVYGRATGWGQTGPLARSAGHDINYLALSGVLDSIGSNDAPPTAPMGHIGDFGGGGLFLAFGLLAALLERERSGKGQVVDAAILDGAALLDSLRRFFALHGAMPEGRGSGPLDGGSHFYNVYETADGKHITFGAVEPKFHRELLDRLGLDHFQVEQLDHDGWPQLRETIAKVVHTRTRAQWQEHLEGTDVCFAPVLDAAEAPLHRHHLARGTFVTVDGEVQAAPGPRFDRTPPPLPLAPHPVGADALTILADLGFSEAEIERLAASEAVRMPKRSQ